MAAQRRRLWRETMTWARAATGRLDVLALFPIVMLLTVWLGLDDLVFASAMVLPALLAIGAFGAPGAQAQAPRERGGRTGVARGHDALLTALDRAAQRADRESACFVLEIDDWRDLVARVGTEAAETIAHRLAERLDATMRRDDDVVRLGDARFAVVLAPIEAAGLSLREAVVGRLCAAVAEPFAVDALALRLTCCIGHTPIIRDMGRAPEATLAAAEAALADASRQGPAVARTFAPALLSARSERADLADEVEAALTSGDIRPWFQPQICARSGAISGVETLARWHHSERGILAPGQFLGAIDDAGRLPQLCQMILFHALNALKTWDRDGLHVPNIAVNFTAIELRDPGLADHIKWEVDRFDLSPGRLTVEILETVAAENADASLIDNLAALRGFGIALDLDDFGTGQASLSAIRRFGVNRIKIDRSFVLGVDTDPRQQATIAAVVAMAGHLDLSTLAEGVETAEAQAMLERLGCDQLQGYHIARPMPLEAMTGWIAGHIAQLADTAPPSRIVG